MAELLTVALIKSAAAILAAIPTERKRLGRPPLHRGCEIPQCPGKHKAGGLCESHRHIFRRWGDPLHVWVRPKRRSGLECACPAHMPKGSM